MKKSINIKVYAVQKKDQWKKHINIISVQGSI